MKCETCQGKGFTELEHGLIMVECELCNGTGEIDDNSRSVGNSRYGSGDGSSKRTKRVNQPVGSGIPRKSRKQKVKPD